MKKEDEKNVYGENHVTDGVAANDHTVEQDTGQQPKPKQSTPEPTKKPKQEERFSFELAGEPEAPRD